MSPSNPFIKPPTMPSGQYQGTPLTELPDHYLNWLLDEATIHSATLRGQLETENERRRKKALANMSTPLADQKEHRYGGDKK